MKKHSQLQSKLSRVRGLGSAKHGVEHWWLQRVTAVALTGLGLWFVYSLMHIVQSPDTRLVEAWLSVPVNAVFMVLFVIALFTHSKLGVQVIIEDYVHVPVIKYTLLLVNVFLCYGLAVMSIIALFKLHFLGVVISSF